jgi:hypothetical protein
MEPTIKYLILPPIDGDAVYGWRFSYKGEDYGNNLSVEGNTEPDEDIENILIFNAGDSLSQVMFGKVIFPPNDELSLRQIAELEGQLRRNDVVMEHVRSQFDDNGWTDQR